MVGEDGTALSTQLHPFKTYGEEWLILLRKLKVLKIFIHHTTIIVIEQ